MIMGGVPYYWSFLQRSLSLDQNIDRMFFGEQSPLRMEFEALYASLFRHPAPYVSIIRALTTVKAGMTRNEILKSTRLSDNKTFVKALRELEQCGFIRSYSIIGRKKRGMLYQLMDCYTLFYFQFIETMGHRHDEQLWTHLLGTARRNTWQGLAFERLCLWHIQQIKAALGISGIEANAYSWHAEANEMHDGAQIDLLIDRRDQVINLCEMKFADGEYAIDATEDCRLRNRRTAFLAETRTKKTIHTTMITTFGVRHNSYWNSIQSEVTLDGLFM